MLKVLCLILIFPALSFADCYVNPFNSNISQFEEMSNSINVVTEKITKKAIEVEVSWDGSGSISVFQDSAGNLLGIKLSYKGSSMGSLDVAELNKGEKIKFHDKNVSPDPLELGLKSGTKLDPKTGGTFSFKAYIEADKPFFKNYEVQLKKVNGVWKAYRNSTQVNKVTLDPKVSWGSWTGTFKSVTFE
jgi:hypothetical protein